VYAYLICVLLLSESKLSSGFSILQAGGEETPELSNAVNAVTFGAMTVGGFFTGLICNKIGIRWTLIIGTLGYAPYAGKFSAESSLIPFNSSC